jgi:hypothetical protein
MWLSTPLEGGHTDRLLAAGACMVVALLVVGLCPCRGTAGCAWSCCGSPRGGVSGGVVEVLPALESAAQILAEQPGFVRCETYYYPDCFVCPIMQDVKRVFGRPAHCRFLILR